jgi:hypothetical protein
MYTCTVNMTFKMTKRDKTSLLRGEGVECVRGLKLRLTAKTQGTGVEPPSNETAGTQEGKVLNLSPKETART